MTSPSRSVTPPVPVTGADADGTTARILAAAREEFLLFGIRRTNVVDICKRADCGRRTLYDRFQDKDQLVSAVLWNEIFTAAADIVAVADTVDPSDAAVEMFVAAIRTLREHPLLNRLLVTEPEELLGLASSGAFNAVRQFAEGYVAPLTDTAGDQTIPAEILTRVVLTLPVSPDGVIPFEDDDLVREFARDYFVPIMTGERRSRPHDKSGAARASWPMVTLAPFEDDPVTSRILDAAFDEFARKGLRGASMVNIGRQASCSRTTLYRRFPDKGQLIQTLALREVARAAEFLGHELADAAEPAAAVAGVAVALYRALHEHPVLRRALDTDTDTLFNLIQEGNLVALGREFIAHFLEQSTPASEAGGASTAVAAEIIARLIISNILQVEGSIRTDTDEAVRAFTTTYLAPIVTGEARH